MADMNQLPDEIHRIRNLIRHKCGIMVQVKEGRYIRDNKDDNCLSRWALSFNLCIEKAINTKLLYVMSLDDGLSHKESAGGIEIHLMHNKSKTN